MITQALEKCQVKVCKEYSSDKLLKSSVGRLCIITPVSVSFQPKICSADGKQYGVEGEYRVKVRFFGKVGIYDDCDGISADVEEFTQALALYDRCILVKTEQEETVRSRICPRLECQVYATLRFLITGTEEEVSVQQAAMREEAA